MKTCFSALMAGVMACVLIMPGMVVAGDASAIPASIEQILNPEVRGAVEATSPNYDHISRDQQIHDYEIAIAGLGRASQDVYLQDGDMIAVPGEGFSGAAGAYNDYPEYNAYLDHAVDNWDSEEENYWQQHRYYPGGNGGFSPAVSPEGGSASAPSFHESSGGFHGGGFSGGHESGGHGGSGGGGHH